MYYYDPFVIRCHTKISGGELGLDKNSEFCKGDLVTAAGTPTRKLQQAIVCHYDRNDFPWISIKNWEDLSEYFEMVPVKTIRVIAYKED